MTQSPPIREQLADVLRAMITPEVLYFPVRHHSPACAWQIRSWIREHRPRAVLVDVVAPELIGEHKIVARVSSLEPDSEPTNNVAELAVDIGAPRR